MRKNQNSTSSSRMRATWQALPLALLFLLLMANAIGAVSVPGICNRAGTEYMCNAGLMTSACVAPAICNPDPTTLIGNTYPTQPACVLDCQTVKTLPPTPPTPPTTTVVIPAQNSGWGNSGLIQYITGSQFSPPIMAALISTLVMVLLLMAAIVLGSEELKQFVRAEVGQTLVSVLMVVCIIGLLTGVDIVLERAASGVTSPCVGVTIPSNMAGGLTINRYAYCYVDNLYGLSRQAATDSLRQGVDYAAKAYTSTGVMTTRWFLLYVGYSIRPNADQRLDSEIKGQEFSLHEIYMVNLLGQRYMIQAIAPSVGAAALFLGILLRALFYTRKLGGLLIAAGLGLLLVWPATYLLAWVTLNVAVFGPQAISTPPGSTCPASCLLQPPYGYNMDTNANGATLGKDTLDANAVQSFATSHSISSRNVDGMRANGVQPCYPAPDTPATSGSITYENSNNCPSSCRFYPTPPDCNTAACSAIPDACKTIRAINKSNSADDCLGGPKGLSGPNSDWQCSDSQCPSYCKQILPQVKEDKNGGFNGLGVSPSKNANKCGTDPQCQACTLFLRRYNYFGDPSIQVTEVAKDNTDCKICMTKFTDPETGGLPDCMTGVPVLLSGNCDALSACGGHISLDKYLTLDVSAQTGICPTDCRILFNDTTKAYIDPIFAQYCEKDPKISKACSHCPVQCKIPASDLGALGKQTKQQQAGLSGSITCAEAPKFNPQDSSSSTLASTETDNCRLCPLSCRFTNTTGDGNLTFFVSKTNKALPCYYYPRDTSGCASSSSCSVNLAYKNPGQNDKCPDGWKAYDKSNSVVDASCPTLPDPPACAPPSNDGFVYALNSLISDAACPSYITNSASLVTAFGGPVCPADITPGKPGKPGYMLAYVQPNTDASGECSTETALKYCNDSYCSNTTCKADRLKDGPFYCALSDIHDKNSLILDNAKRCKDCASLNSPSNSLGPQCQVLLLDETSSKVYLPAGCDETKCAVGTVGSGNLISTSEVISGIDPVKAASSDQPPACNGFCFPRLTLPSASTNPSHSECADYSSSASASTLTLADGTTLEQYDRAFAGGASCPFACRYDYRGLVPDSERVMCGDGFHPSRCDDECQYATDDANILPTKSTCENAQHYMDCTTVAYAANGKYWFKGDNVLTTLCDGTETTDPCKKEIKDKTDAGYKYTTGPIYSCTALHKYPSLDTEIGGTYRECGDLSMDDKNSALNLCNVPTNADYGDKPLPASCLATYDATKVACQPLIASTKPPTPPAPNSCLNCPLFCRSVITSSLGSSTSLCQNKQDRGNSGWDRGGDAPYCDTGASAVCDMRTDNIPLNSPSFLPGFCGVDSNRFNLSAHDPYPQTGNGQCQWPNEGYGAACPARCRVLASDNSQELPYNCSAYADACKLDPNLPIYCRAAPPSRLCAGCIDCQTDCTARPLVRQNCQELCMPTDAMSGRTDLAPNALVSAMGGAAGNTDWRNLGNEAIAVFILPIFCILITLSFIRATSPFLGGEIELPGILKLI